ncbi:MAG: CotH kinase family protein [Bacteroidales bacterium]|nr:CotH kinase family protein [Bacteroidales bacterium]
MKKVSILLFVLFVKCINFFGQVPNGHFENWQTISNYQINNWLAAGLVTPSTPSHSGNYGVRIQYDTNNMSTALILHGGHDNNLGFIGGVPYAGRPDSLAGFFKCYSPNPFDVALIHVIFKKNGIHLSTDYFFIPLTPDTLNFYERKFKINYNHPTEIPDSVIILATHSNPFQDSVDGGFLIIDDLHFTNSAIPVPNGGFEGWNIQSYDQPQNWFNLNFIAHHHPYYPVQKTSDALNGTFAAKLQNSLGPADTIPGVIMYSQNLSYESGALVVNEKYTSLKGYFKFFPQNMDTMQVFMIMYKADTAVGFAAFSTHQTVNNYTKFDVPIYYIDSFTDIPDSAIIYATAYLDKPLGNSTLFLDELTLINNTQIVINEFMSSNGQTFFDEFEQSEDWIELYNAGGSPVYMNNFLLTDDSVQTDKWRFPLLQLEPDSFLLVVASGQNLTYYNIHTNFKIKTEGEPLIVSNLTGTVCDYLHSKELYTDISYGRFPDGSSNFKYFSKATPKKSNNNSETFKGISFAEPVFSVPSGFFTAPFNLNINFQHPTATVRYTTDGSEPTQNHPVFNQALLIESRAGDTNTISMISEVSLYYMPPVGEVFKTNVIRAKAFIPDSITVRTATSSFFVDAGIFQKYNTPVISLVTDNSNLFDSARGIYVLGDVYYEWLAQNPNDSTTLWRPANFFGRGDAWERPIHVEYFEHDGTLRFSKNAGVRIHGGASRMMWQKSLRLYAKDKYDAGTFNHAIFPGHKKRWNNQPLNTFSELILRNSGNDFGQTFFRDALMHVLISHTKVDFMAFQPSIVFLNGEFWGFHNIREKQNSTYLSNHYNMNEEDVVVLEGYGHIDEGQFGDDLHYFSMIDYIEQNDISQNTHYNYIKTQMDVENFMAYQAFQIYYRNTDWPGNNIKFWRHRTTQYEPGASYGKDGRWRWLLYDTDFGFGMIDNMNAPVHNTLEYACEAGNTDWPNPDWSTFLFRTLLTNTEFRNGFINYMADHINTSFKQNRMLDVIDSIQSIYAPLMQENINRWRLPVSLAQWDDYIDVMRNFALYRSVNVTQHIMNKWNISGSYTINLDVSNPAHGSIKINSVLINESTIGINGQPYPWSGKYFNNIPIVLKAIPKPGYSFVEWQGTGNTNSVITISPNQTTSYTAVFMIDTNFQNTSLHINEFMASNTSTIADNFGEFDDWIEIYNASPDTINIGGYYITDNLNYPTKYQFPTGSDSTKIPSGGFLLIWADGEIQQGILHTNFSLSAGGEAIGLYASDGLYVMDTLSFGQQVADISFGCYPDGSSNIVLFNIPTPGASNVINDIAEISQDFEFNVYPNPSYGNVVHLSRAVDVKLYDIIGNLVYEKNNTSIINTNNLQKGIYFIHTDEEDVVKLVLY